MSAHPDARSVVAQRAQSLRGNFIDGQWVESTGTTQLQVYDPATAGLLTVIQGASSADASQAVDSARAAGAEWHACTLADRAGALSNLTTLCEAHMDEFVALEAVDSGKPISTVREFELPACIDAMRLFAHAARLRMAPAAAGYAPDATSVMRHEPHGVVAAITPWNYPLLEAVGKVFPALAAGNTVVLKPAESTPFSTSLLAELAGQVLPAGVLNVVFGDGPTAGDTLVRHPDVAMVSFTGSVATGRRVAATAAGELKKLVMELGGNTPVAIFADADLERALDIITASGLYNSGQDCMAASRLLVHASVMDQFVDGLVTRCREVTVGDPLDLRTQMGPLNSAPQRAQVEAKLAQLSSSSTVVTGGNRPELPGYYLQPTVVVGCGASDALVTDETFGPVFTVQPFTEPEEALQLANDTPYGLAASVFTQDVSRAWWMSNGLNFGTVWVNDHFLYGPDLPMSGFGASGLGTESSALGVLEFSRVKHIAFNHS